MTDFTDLDIVHDNYFLVWAPCACRGNPECDCVDGKQIVGECDLGILLRNLADAGALERAFILGCDLADDVSTWECNTAGRPAP